MALNVNLNPNKQYMMNDVLGITNNKTALLRDTVHQTSQLHPVMSKIQNSTNIHGELAAATNFPRDVWWTESRNYTVLSLSRDVQNTKFNQCLPVVLKSINMSESKFRKRFLMWRDHTTWLDCGKRVI